MAQTYNKLKIDIKEPITDIITAKQNDSNSRFLDVYLYDGGIPIDLIGREVRIYMLKADGTEIFNNGTITDAAAGRCQFELTDQALGAYGKLLCEISIWYDNVQILTTQTFGIDVVKSLRTNGSIESSNEYGALVVLYQNLYEAIDLMTTMVELFGKPGEISDEASIATFWQMLEYLYSVNNNALANSSTQGVLDVIGETDDTGGSATAGTLMAKANAIFGKVNTSHGSKEITAAGTTSWTVPDNVYHVFVVAQGGQGGGGGGQGGHYHVVGKYHARPSGGGSGGTSKIITALISVTPNSTISITIGAGGRAGTGGSAGTVLGDESNGVGTDGGTGGDTKFGSYLTVSGGYGGKKGVNSGTASGGAAAGYNALTAKSVILNELAGLSGNSSATTASQYADELEGGNGGSAKTSQTGLASGAGGKGGFSSVTASNVTAGSNGAAGKQGYMKIVW